MTRSSRRAAVAITMIVALLGVGILPALASPESDLISKINSARRSAGKAKLTVLSKLSSAAESHARQMRKQQKIFNKSNIGSVYDGWKSLGQIVGVGPDVDSVFDAFMGSSAHRKTIRGSYNYVGAGVAEDENGIVWISVIFMNHPDDDLGGGGGGGTTTTTTTKAPRPTTTSGATTTTTSAPTTTKAPDPTTTTTTTTEIPEDDPPSSEIPRSPGEPGAPEPDEVAIGLDATTTTTTDPIPATTEAAAAPAPAAADPPAGNSPLAAGAANPQGISAGAWAGLAAVAFGIFAILILATRLRPNSAGVAASAAPVAGGFEACTRCGLLFNQQVHHHCPNCGLASA